MEDHIFLFVCGCIILLMFLVYVYVHEHQELIVEDESWRKAFLDSGFSNDQLKFITHDSDVWYYKGRNTCVSYGDFEEDCNYKLAVCSRGSPPYAKYGSRSEQARGVMEAVKSGGEHPLCPIIYQGAK